MRPKFTAKPPYKSRPGTEVYEFQFNGIKIPIQRTPQGVWKCWCSALKEDYSIELTTLDQRAAEEALGKLLLLHFGPLVNMLKEPEGDPFLHLG